MKKIACFLTIFVLATAIFANDLQNTEDMLEWTVFIDGNAISRSQRQFFIENFQLEAAAFGYTVKNNIRDAAFTFLFNIDYNMVEFEDGAIERAPPYEPQYVIEIIFTRNFDNVEVVRYNFLFSELHEMYDYTQLLFFRAIVNVPFPTDVIIETVTETVVETVTARIPADHRWRNQWLYLRLSVDNPITFYNLRRGHASLYAGDSVFAGDISAPDHNFTVSNRVISLPGLTLGLEFQFLNWLSIEPNIRLNMGDPINEDDLVLNMFAGASLKFPIKVIDNVKFSPFLAFTYSLNPWLSSTFDGFPGSDTFYDFPPWEIGGGIQVNIRAGQRNALFFHVSYMHTLGNVRMHNPYIGRGGPGDLSFPNPDVIPFERFVINVGVGFKFGFINRNR